MRWVGRFQELGGDSASPSLVDQVGTASEADAFSVATFLRSGLRMIDVMEMLPDVIDGSPVAASGSVLSDGTWMWREDLAHYVEKYRIDLGAEFASAVSQGVPDLDTSALRVATRDALRLWSGREAMDEASEPQREHLRVIPAVDYETDRARARDVARRKTIRMMWIGTIAIFVLVVPLALLAVALL